MKDRIRYWAIGTAVSLALAGLWFALGGTGAVHAKGKPGGDGGGKTSIRLARIAFVDESGIRWDEQAFSSDPVRGEDWDYWDHRDSILTNPDYASRIDVSGGGRVKFFTTGQRDRWLTLDFRPNSDGPHPDPFIDADGNGPDIDVEVYTGATYPPDINPDTFIDNVKATITLDSMFKKTATRQPLDLTIRAYNDVAGGWPGTGWSLHSVSDLYIVDDPDDSDVRVLTTRNPQTQDHDAADFELWRNGETIGTYYFPLTWEMRIVALP